MAHPLIGITVYGRDADNRFSLPAEYLESVCRAGGLPVLLTPVETQIESVMNRLDGVIFAGGGDIDPAQYDAPRHESNYMLDAERDSMEIAYPRWASVVARRSSTWRWAVHCTRTYRTPFVTRWIIAKCLTMHPSIRQTPRPGCCTM